MNYVAIKDNFVATENGKVISQVSYNKCFYVATKFSTRDRLKEGFLSRQRKLCRDIKFRVQNKGQQDFVAIKKFSIVTNKNEVEVNSVATKKSLS